MTNKEKYKQAFSAMHISDEFSLEEKNMKTTRNKPKLNRLVACIAVCVMMVGCATVAYAADVGGIQRTIQLWIHGDQTEATIAFDGNGSYSMDYTDSEGNIGHQGGGGVAMYEDGTERPLTEDELLESISDPEVAYEKDGSVWIYYFDQKIDISNKFQDGVCYARVSNGEETLYMTIQYENGWSSSPHKYPMP